MANKLNLLVQFTGIDKLSGGLRNIIGASKASSQSLRQMKQEVKENEKELKRVRELLAQGGLKSGLVLAEQELSRAISETNAKIETQKAKLERIAGIQTRFGGIANAARSVGTTASIALTAPITAFTHAAIQAGRGNAAAAAQVKAALESMGQASGRTFEQLNASSLNLMRGSLYEQADIQQKVQAQLLTFGNVSGTVFDRAQQAAVDLSARLGQDLQSSAIGIGKALNDPMKGITALSRVGVSFSESQKAMIRSMVEAGNVAGAQNIILRELERQYGGAAAAARDADPGGALAVSFAEFQGAVGDKLLPKLEPLLKGLARLVDSFAELPESGQNAILIIGGLAAVLGPVLIGVAGVASAIATLAPLLAGTGGAVAMFAGVWLPLIALVGYVAYQIYTHWDQIVAFFVNGWQWVKSKFSAGAAAVEAAVEGALSAVPDRLRTIGRLMMDGLLLAINPMALAAKLITVAKNGMTAFRNYLGIKSPSRLMMQMGGHLATGLGMGLEQGGGRPVRAMGRMAGAVAGAGAMALAQPAAARPAAAAPPAAAKIEIHVHQQPGEDANALAERVARLVEQARRGQRLRSFEDRL